MAVITIREQSQTETGFNVTLVIQGDNYQITLSDPFDVKQEQELEWYFEDWLRYPILEQIKADRAKASVEEYGKELFKQVFQSDIRAFAKYSQIRNDLSQVQIEIESITPEFHALHWETLQDPELPRPFSIDSVLIRKSVRSAVIEAQVKEFPTINLLVVVARPNTDRDVGYRTISRPLVEVIRNSQLRVNIELLRPGTYEALSRHLEAKGSGYYHIVHFDVHGALKTYANLQQGIEHNRYLYNDRYGRGKIESYEGVKAFLALEGEAKGEYDLVEAEEIANLLTGKGIPVCILNACQSGKQLNQVAAEDNRETSLGSRLMNAGIQMVVAMSYSVTVTAAEIMMQQIYKHLFDRRDLNQAIRLGRKELYNRKGRKAYYNTEIDLEDWLLPVTYCNREVAFNLREFTPEEEEQYYLSLDSKYEFPQPTYGFVGRDLDILLIEKALLKHNILLLQGMGGTGKTTLLNYLREWWQVTNFAQDIFYFGYDVKAYTLQQIIYEIGKQVYDRFECGKFQAMSLTAQWRKLSQKLRAESYILILDNLESVTGQPFAIQNTLDKPARDEIKKFLASLVGGKTKVILGSRINEQWLQESTFRDNIYQLKGLDAQASTDLAKNILQRVNSSKSINEIKTDARFQRLMKLLAGYPLAMEVVLANLKKQSPAEILEQLEKAEIDPGGDDKTNNIIKCIEYSYSNLSESAQKLLLCLSPFKNFIQTVDIFNYGEELKKLEPFQNYDLEKLEATVTEAAYLGLLSPIRKDYPQILTIQPVLPYFLNSKLAKAERRTKEALQEAFKNYYFKLAAYYYWLMLSKESPKKTIALVLLQWEYENLYQALQICLKQQERVCSIWKCLYNYLGFIGNKAEQLKLSLYVYNAVKAYQLEKRDEVWEEDIIEISIGLSISYQHNYDNQAAKITLQNTLKLISSLSNDEKSKEKKYFAMIYNELGLIAKESRRYHEAQNYFLQSLDIVIKYKERDSLALTLHNLGVVSQYLNQYQQAQDYLQQALDIKIEFGDRYQQAATFHQLGSIAQDLKQYGRAIDYFQQALNIYVEYHDRSSQARLLYQLGSFTLELRQYDQAEDYFRQALDILIENNNRYYQAHIFYRLGVINERLEQYQQARNYFQQALNIYIEYDDKNCQADVRCKLGLIAWELKQYQQARDYLQQALDIYIEYNNKHSQAGIYGELGLILVELSDFEQAKHCFIQALKLFIEYKNKFYSGLMVSSLASLYRITEDKSILTQVAAMLDLTETEAKELFEQSIADDE